MVTTKPPVLDLLVAAYRTTVQYISVKLILTFRNSWQLLPVKMKSAAPLANEK